MIMTRKISTIVILLVILSTLSIPVMAAGGNGGSAGSDGAGSGGSGNGGVDSAGDGGDGSGGDSAGNAGNGGVTTPGASGPQAQPIQEEQKREQQETVEQPGIQINQQDRDQAQGRTGVDTTAEPTGTGIVSQSNRDLFLERVGQLEREISQAQDRQQAQVDVALYAFSNAGNVTAGAGPELNRLAGDINGSLADSYQAEQQIKARSSFSRMLFGGDQEAAGLLIQYADQNMQRISLMEQLVANCSDCDPQVQAKLEEQVQLLSQEQNRLASIGQQEQGERGLFGWLWSGSGGLSGTGQATALTDDEIQWMKYMREEEKLARDVYLSLGSMWNLPIFTNIAQSEQTHMDSIKTLLDRYGVSDPAEGKAQGEFEDMGLQQLHDDLIAKGSISREEALRVGVRIEETDIEDLNRAIAATEKSDILNVYNNLLQGSLNHLDAFETDLARY